MCILGKESVAIDSIFSFFCGKLEAFVNGSFLKIFVSLNIMNKEGRTDFRNNARFGIEIQIPISDYD